ncbi:hypothetical protein LIER_10467 [Lithospermum erythrorhizon]|uniref:Reverse transcriptase domain-containing protein n=1 Tax=Lithospermum erythrorhizon TaxID=34254 RepID=A0AAV3PKM7_LITER
MEQYVLCKVVMPSLPEFYLSAVYGATVYGDRRALWKNLVDNMVVDAPWVIAGDFNIFKDPDLFRGGKLLENVAMDEFKCCIDDLDVTELDVHGQPPEVSDHCLLSIHLKDNIVSGPRPFKYHKFWEEHPDYVALIRGCWDGYAGDGSAFDGLIGRLRKVKGGLKELNRKCFVDISGKVKQCAEELREVQERIYDGIVDSELMCKERNLREVFVRYSRAEMELLKSKARATYLEKRDFSTSFFHRSVVAYTQRHKISMIEDGDGVCHKESVKVEGVIVQFYKNFFRSKGPLKGEHKDIIRKTVTAIVPEEYWGQLVALPSLEEVKRAFHDMANGKSPGPDGFSSEFYKHNWNVVGGVVYEAIVHVFATGEFPAALNATTITLVPKVEYPKSMKEYRPIPCCNILYKAITRILGRMRGFMSSLVSLSQSTFIPGRSLTDSVLLLQELVQGYHKEDGNSKMAIKMDLQKTYDMVEWEHLWVVMETMAFPSSLFSFCSSVCRLPSFL